MSSQDVNKDSPDRIKDDASVNSPDKMKGIEVKKLASHESVSK